MRREEEEESFDVGCKSSPWLPHYVTQHRYTYMHADIQYMQPGKQTITHTYEPGGSYHWWLEV